MLVKHMPFEQSHTTTATDDRRCHERIAGPFDGLRVGALETPVRIYDLSRGGCFINAMHEQAPGVKFMLKIDLPGEGWIQVRAETLYHRPEYGFAVRFIEMTEETAQRLNRTIDIRMLREPHGK